MNIIQNCKTYTFLFLSVTDDSKDVQKEKTKERVSSGRKSRTGKCLYVNVVNIGDVCQYPVVCEASESREHVLICEASIE